MQSLSVLLSLLLTPNYGRGMFGSVAKRLVIEDLPHRGAPYSWRNGQPYRGFLYSCDNEMVLILLGKQSAIWGGGGGSTFLPRDFHIPREMGPPGPHSPGNMGTQGPHFTVSLFSHDIIKFW